MHAKDIIEPFRENLLFRNIGAHLPFNYSEALAISVVDKLHQGLQHKAGAYTCTLSACLVSRMLFQIGHPQACETSDSHHHTMCLQTLFGR